MFKFQRTNFKKFELILILASIQTFLLQLAVLINGFVLSLTSEFIPRLVYTFRYSPDQTLSGYIDWSLSKYNISGFSLEESPFNMPEIEIGDTHVFKRVNETICRYCVAYIITAILFVNFCMGQINILKRET